MNVELIYDAGCPNVEVARQRLSEAFAIARMQARWQEWERSAPDAPAYVRRFGSPTILVEGADVVAAGGLAEAPACRLYRDASGRVSVAPSVSDIAAALMRATAAPS